MGGGMSKFNIFMSSCGVLQPLGHKIGDLRITDKDRGATPSTKKLLYKNHDDDDRSKSISKTSSSEEDKELETTAKIAEEESKLEVEMVVEDEEDEENDNNKKEDDIEVRKNVNNDEEEEVEEEKDYDGPLFMKSPSFRDLCAPTFDSIYNNCLNNVESVDVKKSDNIAKAGQTSTAHVTDDEVYKHHGYWSRVKKAVNKKRINTVLFSYKSYGMKNMWKVNNCHHSGHEKK